jgi:hypothetical protein
MKKHDKKEKINNIFSPPTLSDVLPLIYWYYKVNRIILKT